MSDALTIRWAGGERTVRPGDAVVIGREESCTIAIGNPVLSRRHCHLEHEGGQWVLVDDASTQGTFVEGRRVAREVIAGPMTVVLGQGDRAETISFTALSSDARTQVPTSPSGNGVAPTEVAGLPGTELPHDVLHRPGGVLRERGPAAGTIVTDSGITVECAGVTHQAQPGQIITIGRDGSNTIVSTNPTVSREHATIAYRGGAWMLDDRSTRGTFHNERRLTGPLMLVGATVVMLGDPSAGERVVAVASGEREKSAGDRIEDMTRGRLGRITVAAVAALAVVVLGLVFVVSRGGGGGGSSDPDVLARATVRLQYETSDSIITGSGTIVDAKRGLILTNAHVAKPSVHPELAWQLPEDPTDIVVSVAPDRTRPAEPRFRARLVVADGVLDLAVVRIEETLTGVPVEAADLKALTALPLGDSDKVQTQDAVRVFGYPAVSESPLVTMRDGVIASPVPVEELKSARGWFNVSATIDGGNSGGLAADQKGRIVGVPTMSRLLGDARIDRIRPINFAKPLIDAARADEPAYKSEFGPSSNGNEKIDQVALSDYDSASGFSLSCQEQVSGLPVDTSAVGLRFQFSGFTPGRHTQLLAVLVSQETGEVVAAAESHDQWPLAWKPSGCGTATLAMVRGADLSPGTYTVRFFTGGDYREMTPAFDLVI